MRSDFKKLLSLAFFAFTLVLAGCSGVKVGEGYTNPNYDDIARDKQSESIFGDGGLSVGGKTKEDNNGGGGIGVNGFLWRASLDTISFMPLISADPFGGVIITDWHSPGGGEDAKTERFKLTVYILSKDLRADGIKVSSFKQRLDKSGNWIDSPPDAATANKIENAILSRAREMRIAAKK